MRATGDDAELCFGIARAAAVAGFQHVFPPDLYEFPADAIRADWISALIDPEGETYIALEDDEGVGVVSVGHGVLQTLYVMPEFWGRGVGTRSTTSLWIGFAKRLSGRRTSGRSPKIIERAPSTRNADGLSPAGLASCRSRHIRSTLNMRARQFAASSCAGLEGLSRHVNLTVVDQPAERLPQGIERGVPWRVSRIDRERSILAAILRST